MGVIVVIEDDPDVQRLLAALLEEAGHQVETARDGVEGVQVVERVRPDLVLVDVGLPGSVDGLEVTRRLRAGDCADVPVLALTAHGDPRVREAGEAAGVTDYLVKPEGIVGLVARVAELIA